MTEKKQVILLVDCFYFLTGGAEKQIYELVNRLNRNKYYPIVISLECGQPTPDDVVTALGCEFHRFPVKRIYGLSGFIQGIRFSKFIRAISKQRLVKSDNSPICRPPDSAPQNNLILITYHFSSDIWGTFWAHLAGVKTIISNRRDMGFWRGRQHIWAYKFINHWVTKVVVVANAVKELVMRDEGMEESKVEVIYNGIDLTQGTSHELQVRQELGLKTGDKVIMCVGNLRPVKGHRYLIEAVANLKSQIPNIKLVLIGDGESRQELMASVQRLAINDNVIFLGKRSNARELLPAADICVLPSLSEGMSNAILEYMAAGKPVIATRVGGNPELVVDGETGILVDKEDSAQLANALLRLIENTELRIKMGQAGLKRVREQFAMERMIERYEKLFNQVIGD